MSRYDERCTYIGISNRDAKVIGKYVYLMFNMMRQINAKIDQKSEYISEVFLFQFTNVLNF